MKSEQRRTLFVIALVLMVVASVWLISNKGNAAPDISFTDIDNNSHKIADYKGQPLLVIFWATDCPGCIEEIPELISLKEHYQSQGLGMIAVAMSHDSLAHIKAMRTQRQLPYTITWDKDNSIAEAFDRVRVTPTHFLIDKNGEIIMRKIGTLDMNLLHNKLQAMGLSPT